MNVAGKVAVITGAADGFGKAFTQALLKKQIKAVGILDIQQAKGKATLKQLANEYGDEKVHFIQCDVTDKQQFEGAFNEIKNRYGQIDIVCNNAGICDEFNWEKMVEVNVTAVIRGSHLATKYMSKANGGTGGAIVNVASMAGITSVPFVPAYAATKHAVVGLSRSLAGNPMIMSENIRVNVLCPSFADTAILNVLEPYGMAKEDILKLMSSVGILPVSTVAEAFMKLVEEDRNGQVMRVTPTNGIDLKKYRESKL